MHKFLVLIIFFCGCLNSKATLPPALEREVNVAFNKESVHEALQKIQTQSSVIFSYQTHLIENLPPVTLQLKKASVREVLSLILPKKNNL